MSGFKDFVEKTRQKYIQWSNELDDFDWKITSQVEFLDAQFVFELTIKLDDKEYKSRWISPNFDITQVSDQRMMFYFYSTRFDCFNHLIRKFNDADKFKEISGWEGYEHEKK